MYYYPPAHLYHVRVQLLASCRRAALRRTSAVKRTHHDASIHARECYVRSIYDFSYVYVALYYTMIIYIYIYIRTHRIVSSSYASCIMHACVIHVA